MALLGAGRSGRSAGDGERRVVLDVRRRRQLRIQCCTDCATYVDPLVTIRRKCRSRALEAAPASGWATVVGRTVNTQPRPPGFDFYPPN